MSNLHEVEGIGRPVWSDDQLENLMVFCLLDKQMSYDKVCLAYDMLKKEGYTTRAGIQEVEAEKISEVLKAAGYRFWRQTGNYIKEFGDNEINLRTADRPAIKESIKGIGMKLSSMFLVKSRGEEYAILDVHIKRWLEDRDLLASTYEKSEENFIREAKRVGMTVEEFDIMLWEQMRKK